MRHLLDSYSMSNLLLNIFKVLNGEVDKRNLKTNISFSKKEIRTVSSKPSFTLLKM